MKDLTKIAIAGYAQHLSQSIDRAIFDEIFQPPNIYRIEKSWTDRRGGKMYRISVSGKVREWLETSQSQYGKSNPEWWKFKGEINITAKMLSMLILRWGNE